MFKKMNFVLKCFNFIIQFLKVTPPHMEDVVYCARHAAIRTVKKLMTHLQEFVQDLDSASISARPHNPSRYEEFRMRMQVIFYS